MISVAKIEETAVKIGRFIPWSYQNTIRRNLEDGDVLDIACGNGNAFSCFIRNRKPTHPIRVGGDISLSDLKLAKGRSIYTDCVLCNMRELPFREKSFDIVLSSQSLEHIQKQEGLKLIEEMERIGRKQVIIGTPNGFLAAEGHLCGWSADELKALGYKVFGCGSQLPGSKFFRLWRLARCMAPSFPFTHWLPNLASQLVAVKHLPPYPCFRAQS